MSYKDKCFCGFYNKCKQGQHCARALTEDVEEEATIFGALISQYASEPQCYEGEDNV